jgi:hypothetical protein
MLRRSISVVRARPMDSPVHVDLDQPVCSRCGGSGRERFPLAFLLAGIVILAASLSGIVHEWFVAGSPAGVPHAFVTGLAFGIVLVYTRRPSRLRECVFCVGIGQAVEAQKRNRSWLVRVGFLYLFSLFMLLYVAGAVISHTRFALAHRRATRECVAVGKGLEWVRGQQDAYLHSPRLGPQMGACASFSEALPDPQLKRCTSALTRACEARSWAPW